MAACGSSRADRTSALLETSECEIDWTRLVQTAFDHGVTGLLCDSLLRLHADQVPTEIRDACAEHLRASRESNRALAIQLFDTLDALEREGVEAIPFKGPALALVAYGDLALRSFRDLDFLIREDQMRPCLDTLRELGYLQSSVLSPKQWREFLRYSGQDVCYGKGAPFEPHWAFAPWTLALDIDYAGIRARAVRADIGGRRALCLAPEDELIVLCVHGSKEQWAMLKWVADVAEFVMHHPSLDWRDVVERAQSQHVARIVVLGLGLAARLLDAPLSAAARRWIEADPFARAWSERLARNFFQPRASPPTIYQPCRFHWDMRERFVDRIRYLYRTVTQPRESHFVALKLPDTLFILYWPYKVLHDYLAQPAWSAFKALRRGAPAATIGESRPSDDGGIP